MPDQPLSVRLERVVNTAINKYLKYETGYETAVTTQVDEHGFTSRLRQCGAYHDLDIVIAMSVRQGDKSGA